MALSKQLFFNGYEVSYWNIHLMQYNKIENKTYAEFRGYKDKASRDLDIKNTFPASPYGFTFNGNLDEAEVYALVKQPIIMRQLMHHGSPTQLDENGEVIAEAISDEYMETDTNPLSGATDI